MPLLEWLERLPGPQRDALATTFGLSEGAVPDRFFVGLATLGLLSEAAEERPLVCVVDDAQWLDRASAQALAFVARRLLADSVVILFAAREPSDETAGLPKLVLEGLRGADARSLLDSVLLARLDESVLEKAWSITEGHVVAVGRRDADHALSLRSTTCTSRRSPARITARPGRGFDPRAQLR